MVRWFGVVAALFVSIAVAQPQPQPPKPTPAFPGQTDAPPPKDKSRYRVTVITDQLAGPWVDRVPSGRQLPRLASSRVACAPCRRQARCRSRSPACRPSRSSRHRASTTSSLDPDFATNRYVYFSYFAPPKGEEAKRWPLEHFYNEVWEKSLAERRVLDLGFERVARAKLSADDRRLEDVDVLIDGARGAPSRVRARQDAIRHGRRRVPVLRQRSRRRRARLHGRARHPPQLQRPRDPHQPRRHYP